MNKEELEKKLAELRNKWKIYPKSYLEPNWCSFRVDKSKAVFLIEEIKKIDAGELSCSEMEKLLT